MSPFIGGETARKPYDQRARPDFVEHRDNPGGIGLILQPSVHKFTLDVIDKLLLQVHA